jgi:peptidyl-prolyl cis-trans isomerase-like 4
MSVLLETSVGDIVIDLELRRIPIASENFIQLSQLKLLNNMTVSKIEKGYICIFGSSAEDLGSAEYQFSRSRGCSKFLPVERDERVKHSKMGTVGMVNGGQSFYITLKDGPVPHLDVPPEKTTIIGYVEDGLDVLTKINSAICDQTNVPYNPIRIRHSTVLDDESMKHPSWYPIELPESPEEIVDEILGEVEEEDALVLEERQREAVSKAQQLELELMGDIPSADIRPPNNILFVCQLNPITEDEDLRTVFSRFGEIKKCDIVRDYITGDSLQYAFIEFEREESCNKAYVAMQNVLIDDKRINVDFSQSVSKLWNDARRKNPSVYSRSDHQDRREPVHRNRPSDHHHRRRSRSRETRYRSPDHHHRRRSRSRERYRDEPRRRDDSYRR